MNKALLKRLLSVLGICAGLYGSAQGWPLLNLVAASSLLYFYQGLLDEDIYPVIGWSLAMTLAVSLSNFYWLIEAIATYGHLNYLVSFLIFLLYVVLFQAKLYLPAVFCWLFCKKVKGVNHYLVIIAFILLFDLLYQLFPWQWGSLLHTNLGLRQHATWGGTLVLGLLLFGQGWFLLEALNIHRLKKWLPITIGLPVITLFYALGFIMIPSSPAEKREVNLAIIQPGLGPAHKNDEQYAGAALNRLVNMGLKAIYKARGNLDLLVFPESAVPFHSTNEKAATYSKTFAGAVAFLSKISQADVLFNELDEKEGKTLNAMSIFSVATQQKQTYYKRRLLPFGEYLPFDFLRGIFKEASDYAPGPDQVGPFQFHLYLKEGSLPPVTPDLVAQVNDLEKLHSQWPQVSKRSAVSITPAICYEAMFSSLIKNTPGDIIINLSNDSWFGSDLAKGQHQMVARIRAVENRKIVVRATLNGITQVFDPAGSPLIKEMGPGEVGFRLVKVTLPR